MINGHRSRAAQPIEIVSFPEFEQWVKGAGSAKVWYCLRSDSLPAHVEAPKILDGFRLHNGGGGTAPTVYASPELAKEQMKDQVSSLVAGAATVWVFRLPHISPYQNGYICLARLAWMT